MEKLINKIDFACKFIIFFALCCGLWYLTWTSMAECAKHIKTQRTVVLTDTIHNNLIIDSINVQVTNRDSIIINYKRKIVDEVNKALNADDSTAVEQFISLSQQ